MSILLKVDSSPMGGNSVSRKLTAKFADSWRRAHPGGTILSRDLTTLELPVVDALWITAAHQPEASLTADQKSVLAISDSLIADLQRADEYVFGVPMHNFGIPSTLKLWIDQIVRRGKTFAYTESGPQGLLTGKRVTLLIASGGVYEPGTATAAFNFVAPYLRTLFAFLGVTDLNIIAAEGTAQLMTGKVDAVAFLAPSLERVHTQASL
jgi:FMN-dependent NADH-azoreductase